MAFLKRRYRHLICCIINIFFSGTHFFGIKRWLLNSCGVSVASRTKIVGPIDIGNCSKIIIGKDCWIGKAFTVYGDGTVIIGDNCDLAPNVTFITGSHEIGSEERRAGKGKLFTIYIDDGCWIGARAGLQGNIKIGKLSVIGSFSLVTKNVKENAVVGGIPAHYIKEID